jgi:heat shock protein HslJ
MVKAGRSKRAATLAVGAALVALTGCETYPGSPSHPLDNTNWRLVEIDKGGVMSRLRPELQARHTMRFVSDGSVQMQLDCNRGNGDWSASQPETVDNGRRGTISFGPIAATRALCPSPTFGEAMAADLPTARTFRISPESNRLVLRSGQTRYIFRSE